MVMSRNDSEDTGYSVIVITGFPNKCSGLDEVFETYIPAVYLKPKYCAQILIGHKVQSKIFN